MTCRETLRREDVAVLVFAEVVEARPELRQRQGHPRHLRGL
jgi:hypothetical protein